jgi:hypothetical protein
LLDDESDATIVVVVGAWKHNNFICKNYIFNGLDNTIYDVYSSVNSMKVL